MKFKRSLAVAFTADNDLGFRCHARLMRGNLAEEMRRRKQKKVLQKKSLGIGTWLSTIIAIRRFVECILDISW
jgi:hypothetical protein